MSNRLTFSLTSLILIFALAFAAAPVMAAEGGPTVDIGQGTSKARATFDLTFSFSDPVEAAGSTGGSLAFTWRLVDAQTNLLGTTAETGSATQTAGSRTDYTAQINIAGDTNNVSAVKVIVSVAADAKTGTTTANSKGSQAGEMTFDLPPVQGDTTVTVAAEEATPKVAGKYTVTFTFSADTSPAFEEANIAIPTTGVALSNFTTVTAETVYSVDAQLEFGASNIMVGVDPGYAKPASAGKNMVTLPPPPPKDPVYQNPPTVMLEVVGHDAANRSFQISVSTTPAADTEGKAGTAITGAAIKAALMVKDGGTPAGDVGVNVLDGEDSNEREADNSYRAFLEYGPFDTLPLTVSIDPNDLDTNPNAADVDAVTKMVGEDTTTPTNNAPVFADGASTTRSVAENTAAGMAIGAPVAATDADDDTLTYTLGGTDMASFAIVSTSGQLQTMAALDYETKNEYMVMVTADDGNNGTASIAVTINVTDVDERPANKDPVFAANLPMTITGKSGVAITPVTFTATDSDGGTLAYSWNVDETALGLMLNTETGTVSGTPKKAHTGSHPITVVDGQGGSATHPLTITITGNTAPTFEAFTFPALTANMAHPVTLPAAMDADNDALTYSIRGTLPPGLMASANASMPLRISGTPTAVGTTSVTYVASDNRGGEATLPLTITVNAAPADPEAPAPGAPGAPTGLNANRNDDNSVTLTWTEPTGPITSYRVEVRKVGATTGEILSLRGSHSRYTTTVLPAGTYTITVAAANGEGRGASASVTVAIPPAPEQPDPKPATIQIPTATSSSAPIPLGPQFDDPMVPAYGFAVLVRDVDGSGTYTPLPNTWERSMDTALPDLAWFFGGTGGTNGGTIALNGPGAKKDLVISEIMWGTDSSLAVPERSQWIEFYNATPTAIDLTGYSITFHRSQVPSSTWANARDVVSNAGRIYFGHSEFPGQVGRTNPVDTQGRYAATVNLISMYREINHVGVEHFNVGNRGERDKRITGWKEAVYPTANIQPGRVATPGAEQIVRVSFTATTFAQTIIINEIGNSSNDAYDWVEFHNTTGGTINFKNWDFTRVELIDGKGVETLIFKFPNNDSVQLPAGGFLVVAASNPKNAGNDLAAGIDITKGDADQVNTGLGSKDGIEHQSNNTTAFYYVNGDLKLPNSSAHRLYVLRNHRGEKKDDRGHTQIGSPTHVEDAVGTLSIEVRRDLPEGYTGYSAATRQIWNTATWPFQSAGKRHDKTVDGNANPLGGNKVYQREGKKLFTAEKHLVTRGYTGIGYDRQAEVNGENGGTPGYHKDAVKGDKSNWAGQVSISEIMLATHDASDDAPRIPRATRLPQWIEIFNNSLTEGVNIGDWYLEIRNADSEDLITRDLHGTLRLPSVIIPPNQTVLIVSSAGLNSGNFPDQRLINLFTNGNARNIFSLQNRNDPILSQVGFYIDLRDHKGNPVDKVGNLPDSARRGIEARGTSNFDTEWDLPDMNHPDGPRTSLIRIYDRGTARDGLNPVGGPEDASTSWILASNTNFRNVPSLTYYGNHRDYGTPGYRGGGPLPVGLSKFRPERLESGEIAIRWITSSELNNAGFNILRSETKDGQFTKVNTQLIKGQGTTSEKTSYEWKDTTAKPNVVYYYQIQDVSIDGQVQTLRTTRLRGHISPTGKAATTWGELKALQ